MYFCRSYQNSCNKQITLAYVSVFQWEGTKLCKSWCYSVSRYARNLADIPFYTLPVNPYIHRSASSSRLSHLEFSNRKFKSTWIEIRFPSFSHYFVPFTAPSIPLGFFYSSLNIEILTSVDLSCQITIFGDLNVHNVGWLLHSSVNSTIRHEAESFPVTSELCQLHASPIAHALLTSILRELLHHPLLLLPCLLSAHRTIVSSHFSFFFLASSQYLKLCAPSGATSLLIGMVFVTFRPVILPMIAFFIWYFSVSSFTDTDPQGMHLHIPHFPKLGKPRSSERFDDTCNRAFRLNNCVLPVHRSPNQAFRNCFVQARNKCSSTIQSVKYHFVRHKTEWLALCATGDWLFWALATAISNIFCLSNFPPIRNSSGPLVSDQLGET